MKRFATVVALVLGGCVGDPKAACEEAELDVLAWRCEVCPGSSWCPTGEPVATRTLCTGSGEQLEVAAVRFHCDLACSEELVADGVSVCPPHELGAPWIGELVSCVAECTGAAR